MLMPLIYILPVYFFLEDFLPKAPMCSRDSCPMLLRPLTLYPRYGYKIKLGGNDVNRGKIGKLGTAMKTGQEKMEERQCGLK